MSVSARARLPSVDRILGAAGVLPLIQRWGRSTVRDGVRTLQAGLRSQRLFPDWAREPNGYAQALQRHLEAELGRGLVPVFNLTGTLLHTNLGRTVLGDDTIEAGMAAARDPVALEYDLESRRRGDRDAHVEPLIRAFTGAEAATVVNNNAAALVLVLNTLALQRGVPVSRGELIEIGGSFRLPDIMARSGCLVREVGTTNRTHPADFEDAIDDATGLLLKVHPSNYRIEGYASAPSVPELAAIARSRGVPLCVDLGSGTLVDLVRYGLPHEPTPREVLEQGADLVTFSGDKLLGSVQAGVIAGRACLVERLKRNPLKRALRADKITLAMLRHTLTLYGDPDRLPDTVPLFRWLAAPLAELEQRAQRVLPALAARLEPGFRIAMRESRCEVGSGSVPQTTLPSRAVCIMHDRDASLRDLDSRLRALPKPVLARLHDGALWLDMRTLDDVDGLLVELERLAGV